jgi:hypothetical protein
MGVEGSVNCNIKKSETTTFYVRTLCNVFPIFLPRIIAISTGPNPVILQNHHLLIAGCAILDNQVCECWRPILTPFREQPLIWNIARKSMWSFGPHTVSFPMGETFGFLSYTIILAKALTESNCIFRYKKRMASYLFAVQVLCHSSHNIWLQKCYP